MNPYCPENACLRGSRTRQSAGLPAFWRTRLRIGSLGRRRLQWLLRQRLMPGAMAASPYLGPTQREEDIAGAPRGGDDPHLRSIKAVTGYHIQASDGEIGHVEDFLVEDADWSIHYLVVDTKNWWPGKKVLIPPRLAREIDWTDKLVNLDVDRQKVKDSPAYDPTKTVDQAYEERFYNHYGDDRPGI